MKTLKPFNLEAAKAGAKVVTRNGNPVRIICYDRKDYKYPIIALVEHEEGYERIQSYSTKGRFYDVECHANDLFMAPVKREG